MNPKEPEYMIVEASSAAKLGNEVRRLIGDGWRPQGGVSGFYNLSGFFYQQAVVRP